MNPSLTGLSKHIHTVQTTRHETHCLHFSHGPLIQVRGSLKTAAQCGDGVKKYSIYFRVFMMVFADGIEHFLWVLFGASGGSIKKYHLVF